MQLSLDLFGASPLIAARSQLRRAFPSERGEVWLDPVSQLIKSLISSQTKDHVSGAAFARLQQRYAHWDDLMRADLLVVLAQIGEVTHAEVKAPQLIGALQAVHAYSGALTLDFLAALPNKTALAWLENIKGVGRKIAAAVLNFSTLRRRAFVIDTHVLRVSRRLGWIAQRARTAEQAYDALMAATPSVWDADDLSEMHWLLKRLGQSYCRHGQTECGQCPLRSMCPRVGLRTNQETMFDDVSAARGSSQKH